ncbi:formimidoylglutamate deiminase [Methylobacterium sp. J-030]|uniref:formimidoylglutamate deiminase n=1 Tax=Methylobacterium sp. J-030 TaxID=2836627 RepID=UPI001FBB61EC|nr:formimidoylglutamate deiminase [Methylobacterium sp. J-030]MCJ2071350.1 formimidoylglutamate deiminase [Methylobacterium sp. J-030]
MTGLFFDTALLPGGWADDVRITLTQEGIASVDAGAARAPDDAHHAVGLPGLASLHSHAFQRAMAGLTEARGTEADSFWTWRELMYRFVGRITPDQVEAVAAQAYAEMLEGGFTRVGEFHYLHHAPDGAPYTDIGELSGRIVAAAAATGIGLTLLPVFYAQSGFGGLPPEPGQRRFVTGIDAFARLLDSCRSHARSDPGIVIGVAPHSLRAVTPSDLERVAVLAPDSPIHLHIAEQEKEVRDCLAWCGQRPVDWLLDRFAVDGRWTLIHATHLSDDETDRLASSGAVAGLCPVTEANLGDGTFPAVRFLKAGGTIGIGTDSNVCIGAADELRQLEYSQRLALRARNALSLGDGRSTGRTLFDACLAGGARSLGTAPGELAPGAVGDILCLRRGAALAGRSVDAVLDTWVFAARESPVDEVWVRGRRVVRGGRHVRAVAIGDRYRAVLKELLA